MCRLERLFAGNARAMGSDDPDLMIEKLADGQFGGSQPGRFARFAAPIASRLERTQMRLVRSLERLPISNMPMNQTGEADAVLIFERRVARDLQSLAVDLHRTERRASERAITAEAIAQLLYETDSQTVEKTERAAGVPQAVFLGRAPRC
jgi:hypothetical protein